MRLNKKPKNKTCGDCKVKMIIENRKQKQNFANNVSITKHKEYIVCPQCGKSESIKGRNKSEKGDIIY